MPGACSIARLTQLQELRLCCDDSMDIIDIGPLCSLSRLTHLAIGTGAYAGCAALCGGFIVGTRVILPRFCTVRAAHPGDAAYGMLPRQRAGRATRRAYPSCFCMRSFMYRLLEHADRAGWTCLEGTQNTRYCDCAWLCVVMSGCAWLCEVVRGRARSCEIVHGHA